MCLSWGILLPWGVTIASRTRKTGKKGAWFKLHLRFQIIGTLLQIVGFVLAIIHVQVRE